MTQKNIVVKVPLGLLVNINLFRFKKKNVCVSLTPKDTKMRLIKLLAIYTFYWGYSPKKARMRPLFTVVLLAKI